MEYQFKEITPHEQKNLTAIMKYILSNEEVQQSVRAKHTDDGKCAVAVFTGPSSIKRKLYLTQAEAMTMFPFEPIQEALDFYEPGESMCIIFIRGNRVAVTVAGNT